MPSAPRIIERLPSLYRPEGHESDLATTLIRAVGASLDAISRESSEVMQAHWFDYADSAVLSSYLARFRQLDGKPPVTPWDPAVEAFGVFSDLPRIGALLDALPWREPLIGRELVEEYRRRLARLVALHRNGLGTIDALRLMTLIALPAMNREAAPGLRERPFSIEEFSPVRQVELAVQARGLPEGLVGPLMRWHIDTASRFASPVSLLIEGQAAVPEAVDATAQPLIERFDPATGTGTGIAYDGTVAPGATLAITAAFQSWLGTPTGVLSATSSAAPLAAANPTAPGPWSPAPGDPAAATVSFAVTGDNALWCAVNRDGTGELWRGDGATFTRAFGGLPLINALAAVSDGLAIGFATGYTRLQAHAADGPAFDADPATLAEAPVNAIAVAAGGVLWLATDSGSLRVAADQTRSFVGLGERPESQTRLRAVHLDDDGTVLFGGDLGAFLRSPAGQWYHYAGEAVSEDTPDWQPFDPMADALPAAEQVFLPPVNAIARAPDRSLWFGTEAGPASYRARERNRTFTTLLDAYPHITQAAVHQIVLDERGGQWFATDTGLLRFDGLDWYQAVAGALVRLTREATAVPEAAGDRLRFCRYSRGDAGWQCLVPDDPSGFGAMADTPLAAAEAPVLAMTWTDTAVAHLGSFDGTTFVLDEGATPGTLRARYKPDPTRVSEGGIPAVPRLRPGTNDFRYLGLEGATDPVPGSRPAWTREGRLLPTPETAAAPFEGRFLAPSVTEMFDRVYAFLPAARVWMRWYPREALTVLVRLGLAEATEQVDPAVLDRLYTALQHVRPAGVRVAVAQGETLVRGG
jgi:hypothetical protein